MLLLLFTPYAKPGGHGGGKPKPRPRLASDDDEAVIFSLRRGVT